MEYVKRLDKNNKTFVCTNQIANDYLGAENDKEAVKYMFLAKELALKTKNPVHIGKANQSIGFYYYQHNDPIQGISYLKEAVNYSIKGLDFYAANRSRIWLGSCMMQLNQIKGISEMISEAMEYFKKMNSITNLAECHRLLGFCNLTNGDYTHAMVNYASARQIYEDTGNLMEQAIVATDMASNYIDVKEYEKAKKYIAEAELLFTDNKYDWGIVTCKTLWAHYYSYQKQYKLAEQFFVQADNLLKKNPKEELLIMNETYWAENAYKLKNTKKGDSLTYSYTKRIANSHGKELTAATLMFLKRNNKQIDGTTFNNIKTLYTKGGAEQLQKTYPHKSLRQIIPVIDHLATINPSNGANVEQDSTLNFKFNNQLLTLETQFRTRIKNDSLKLERQNALLVKDDLKVKNNWLMGSSAFVLLLAGGFMVQRKYRIKAEADKKRIELLKNEIHHRIKNNLGVINRMVDVAEKASITTIPSASLKNRVNAIGLLHQHLYQNELIDEVNMQSYLTGLVGAIKETFETGKPVSAEVEAPIVLSGSTSEKIGLIVNELVTNSYKYAFAGLDNGLIKIGAKRSINGNYNLHVSDNGIGINMQNTINNYGMKLIAGLCYELGGTFSFKNDNGTCFELKFTDAVKR
ncbi:MAG: sensor histidine kinase [Sphingobacteriaceae bacterium]|nr:MAG: sensor histidine kinase [Sphingobacteriaceae bacterium]